jgi:hypothetical protein
MTYNETSNGEPSIILPSIHMNGTSADELLRLNRTAMEALDAAILAMHSAAPNARDFYVQGSFTFRSAQAEHRARLTAVQQVREEYLTLAMHAAKAIEAQRRG